MTITTSSVPTCIGGDPDLLETAGRLFDDHCSGDVVREAATGSFPEALWKRVAEVGLATVGSDAQSGGVSEAANLLHAAGKRVVPLPLAETGLLGGWLYALVSRPAPAGPITVPIPEPDDTAAIHEVEGSWILRGRWSNVPWARSAKRIATIALDPYGRECWVEIDPADARIEHRRNLAGESREVVEFDVSLSADAMQRVQSGSTRELCLRGALSRAAMMAGAMESCVELASAYVKVREQFGKPIGRFQAVQHMLALAAEGAALTAAAVVVAADALDADGCDPHHRVAAARSVAHHAHGIVSKNTHQAFGAIGVTEEHDLHLRTRRLWAWNDEWGTHSRWSRDFGEAMIRSGRDGFSEALRAYPTNTAER